MEAKHDPYINQNYNYVQTKNINIQLHITTMLTTLMQAFKANKLPNSRLRCLE